jgi:multidrug efflux pump subunit AcrA (membrane-fusion protein)
VLVDRGSIVKEGDLLVELSAPEMAAQIAEAESKVQAAEADRLQAEAQLGADQSTYSRMKKAAETPGAIAGNELIQSEKQVDAAKALLSSRRQASRAAQAAVQSLKDLQSLSENSSALRRRRHGPDGSSRRACRSRERYCDARDPTGVASSACGSRSGRKRERIVNGATVPFQVPAWPERTYSGKIARVSHALDPKTRTMPIELDVMNGDGSLAPGMYPTVKWPVRRTRSSLFVPKTSVVTTTERTFVIRDQNGRPNGST